MKWIELRIITIVIIIFTIFVTADVVYVNMLKSNITEVRDTIFIEKGTVDFYNKSPKEGLKEALEYYNVKYPHIVYAQAVLETGNFTSNLCIEGNNLFGLYDSKNMRFFRFNHWTESVKGYINMIQYRYKPDDSHYYKFLKDIGYAEDSLYIEKIKHIVKNE